MAEEIFNDRDISWLSFNMRVLHEILFPDHKIFDKIKFLAIHSNNLDEFSRVRMAQLEILVEKENLSGSGYFARTLEAVRKEANKQSLESRIIFEKLLLPELKKEGIIFYYAANKLSKTHKEEALNIFRKDVYIKGKRGYDNNCAGSKFIREYFFKLMHKSPLKFPESGGFIFRTG